MSAVEDQQEKDQQEQQFHHSQIYTKCVDRKLYCMQFEVINAHLSYKVLCYLHKKYNFIKLDDN